MKVLVTGSSGHLGEALMRMLPMLGHEPVGMDRTPGPFTKYTGSIEDSELVFQCCSGMDALIHTATLHKPHVATHSKWDFINTNISGTLTLLGAAAECGVTSFVYTSTTSAFGAALAPATGAPAAWITEDTVAVPKNIYGVTKTAAEGLCALFAFKHGLSVIVLRTSRFFPEEDDSPAMRENFDDTNSKANEFLFRRVDLEDIVTAHEAAMRHAPRIGFAKYIISAPSPFAEVDLPKLRENPAQVVAKHFPDFKDIYHQAGYKMFTDIDRVYVSNRACRELGWTPVWDFGAVLAQIQQGHIVGSDLTLKIGCKGYHEQVFSNGPYPVE